MLVIPNANLGWSPAGALGAGSAAASGVFTPKNPLAAGEVTGSTFFGCSVGAPNAVLEDAGKENEGLTVVVEAFVGGKPNKVVGVCTATGVLTGVIVAFAPKKLGTDAPVAGVEADAGVLDVFGAAKGAEGLAKFKGGGVGAAPAGVGAPNPKDFGASFAAEAAAVDVKLAATLVSVGLLEGARKLGTDGAEVVTDNVGVGA